MGFRCMYCGKDFDKNKDAMDMHINTVHKDEGLNLMPKNDGFLNILHKIREEYGALPPKENARPPKKKTRKKSVDLTAFEEAAKNGRLEIWVNQNGEIVIENVRSGKTIEIFPTKNMDGEKDE